MNFLRKLLDSDVEFVLGITFIASFFIGGYITWGLFHFGNGGWIVISLLIFVVLAAIEMRVSSGQRRPASPVDEQKTMATSAKLDPSRIKWLKVWVAWILVTGVGLTIVAIISLVAVVIVGFFAMHEEVEAMALTGAAYGLVNGSVVGLCQWVILRSWIRRAHLWIGATALGWAVWAIGTATLYSVMLSMNIIGYNGQLSMDIQDVAALSAPLGGVVVGLLQWRVLRRAVQRASWWLWATVLGWSLGIPAIFFVGNITSRNDLSFIIASIMGWTMMSVVTGIALVFLLDQSRQQVSRPLRSSG